MRVTIRGGQRLDPEVRDLARTRVARALGRFAARVRSLRIAVTDVNGPKGGDDKRCIVEVHLRQPAWTTVIEDVGGSAEAAIGRATDRAGRAVARIIDAARDRRPAVAFRNATVGLSKF